MHHDAAAAALATATRLTAAAEIAAAWAAGEFETVTWAEAFNRGWDAEAEAPKVYRTSDGTEALATPDETEIEFCDDEGNPWALNPTTGIIRRG